MLTAKISRNDETILIGVAAMVGLSPEEFLGLAGSSLVEALTGLRAVMEKSPEVRQQVKELILMRQGNLINDLELGQELMNIADMAGDDRWTPEA